MARSRSRKDPTFDIVVQIVGLVAALVIFNLGARGALGGLVIVAMVGGVTIIVLFLGIVLYKWRMRRGHHPDVSFSAAPAPPKLPTWQLNSINLTGLTSRDIRESLTTAELIQKLRAIDWFQFEKIVGHTYRKLGYEVSRRGGANPDGGIDLIITKDGQTSAVQCKQWKTWNVGVKAVREFLGALTHAGLSRGIFVTLGGYTGDARKLADHHNIEMLNETHLAQMLESVDARFDPEVLALLNKTRKACPKCERDMIRRTSSKGVNAGSQFWGCSAYPKCRFTLPLS